MVQGADGCTMVTGASDSIDLMTPQPLRFMCSGAVLPLQCFTLGVPTARHPADCGATLLYNAAVPCWRTFARRTRYHVGSAPVATRMGCGCGVAAPPLTPLDPSMGTSTAHFARPACLLV